MRLSASYRKTLDTWKDIVFDTATMTADFMAWDETTQRYNKSGKNRYPENGFCGGWYLPGNGALLWAVAMMTAGWDDAPKRHAPGFPADGPWVVKWEGLKTAP